jgi:2'-5' RNA ligase
MQNPRYALVGYVRSPVGEFVENLRRELHPDSPHFEAHLTILPPRPLHGSESAALHVLESICGHAAPFAVDLGDVGTFAPVTPTIFIRVAEATALMRDLHDQLNIQELFFREEWPYSPHLTIAKLTTEQAARAALRTAGERWAKYTGPRQVMLEHLMFVREESPNCWVDLAPVPLGRNLMPR